MPNDPTEIIGKTAFFAEKASSSIVRVMILRYVGEDQYLVATINEDKTSFFNPMVTMLTVEKEEDQPKHAETLLDNLLDIYVKTQGG